MGMQKLIKHGFNLGIVLLCVFAQNVSNTMWQLLTITFLIDTIVIAEFTLMYLKSMDKALRYYKVSQDLDICFHD